MGLLKSALTGARDLLAARRDPRRAAWPDVTPAAAPRRVACCICGWSGPGFEGVAHCESSTCPACGSIARDRFLYHCFVRRTQWRPDLRVLETSPRLGADYRKAMARRVDYLCSDYDERAHRGAITLDLQAIDMADSSLDVVLSAHVLEHVPDTDRALYELHRVLRPGGHLFLQVPLLQGRTAPPAEPEYHGDDTLVYWRFGWDLTARIREQGFACTASVTHDLYRRARGGEATWASVSPEFDVAGILRTVRPDDLTPVATERVARRARFEPSYMFVTWHASRPG